MIVLVVLLGIIAAISLFSEISYRRQIKLISRQLDFLKKHETNMMIRGDYENHGITELIHEINDLLAVTAQIKKDSLDKQNHLKETITSLSHDIRTPLTSLDGYFQLLSQCDNPVDRVRYLNIIQGRIKSLKEMLDELFTFAKLQNDAYEIKFEKCCLNKILLDTIFSFYSDFKSVGFSPEINVCDEKLYVRGNEGVLRRVFQNIIKNCLEHGRDFVQIEMKKIRKQINVTFRNSFDNTDKVDINQIFDMFYKADNARSHASTGLGLAIAKALVSKMDGTITANMTDNIFCITVQFSDISDQN